MPIRHVGARLHPLRGLISHSNSIRSFSSSPARCRTRSILLDQDNPIINKEEHKLHKRHVPKDEELPPDAAKWQANPYLRMLASPLRKCLWSTRVMPKDLLIPIKAASYYLDVPATNDSPSKQTRHSTIFPRGVLHPSTLSLEDQKGRKQNRAYIVCRRSAVYDFVKRGHIWKRLDEKAESNPLLHFQIESQLRRRIVQELQILDSDEKPNGVALEALIAEQTERLKRGEGLLASQFSTLTVAPAAILQLSDSVNIVPPGQTSALVPYWASEAEAQLSSLPEHQVPVYSIPALYNLATFDTPRTDTSSTDTKVTGTPQTYHDLSISHPEIHKRELAETTELRATFDALVLSKLTKAAEGSAIAEVVYIPGGRKVWVPLLIALWRWRMWTGEGWSGNGFGMAAAMGRSI